MADYRFNIHGDVNISLMRELIDEFIDPAYYEITGEDSADVIQINTEGSSDRDTVKREIYRRLCDLTGRKQEWGALTGVRPVKLAGELIESIGLAGARERLSDFYYMSDEKIDLVTDMYLYQKQLFGSAEAKSAGVYIGIPFCPTRCLYCSFASNQVPDTEIERYMPVLLHEIDHVGRRLEETGGFAESIYIGGGTPTTLDASQLRMLLGETGKAFGDRIKELSVEAGRPDTITVEKLAVLKDMGVERISINPQSMKQETLDRIGRSHTPEDIEKAFSIALAAGFDVINADIIAGLPGEDEQDFALTLDRMIDIGASNITVHTLAVKRGSRLHEEDKQYHYRAAETVKAMLALSREKLDGAGFRPYYLYRQKHMAGAMENTGYCRDDKACLYNVRIMDEHQSTLAMGAGGISKKYYPETNRLVRIPNVTNYQEYISRIDEMIERKENTYFMEDKNAD
ncbi:MAG: coproporphyrinogen dehydrogenase HemZ [Eubacterium sp.]|nr:coproporphyrinogen dehydrogenase HemZ [Eubacterium sp.]